MKTLDATRSSGGTTPVTTDDQPPYLNIAQETLALALGAADLDPSKTLKVELTSASQWIGDLEAEARRVSAERVDAVTPELEQWLAARGWALTKTSEKWASGFGDCYKVRYAAKYAHVRRIPGTKDAFAATRATAKAEDAAKRAGLVYQVMDAIEPTLPKGSEVAVIDLTSDSVGLHIDQAEKIQGDLRQTLNEAGWGRVGFRLERKSGWCDVGPAYWIAMHLVVGRDPQPVRAACAGVLFGFGHARARLQQLLDDRS